MLIHIASNRHSCHLASSHSNPPGTFHSQLIQFSFLWSILFLPWHGPIEQFKFVSSYWYNDTLQCNAGNLCLLGKNTPPYMFAVQAGSLMQVITPDYMPPAEAPFPVLNESDVVEPPMPPVSPTATAPSSSPGGVNTTIAPTSRNGQSKIASCFFLPYLAMLLSALFLVWKL